MMDIRLRNVRDPNNIIQVTYNHYVEVLGPQKQWIPIDADGNEIAVEEPQTPEEKTIAELRAQIEELKALSAKPAPKRKTTKKTEE